MQTTKYAAVLPKIGAERSKFLSEAKIKELCEAKNLAEVMGQLRDSPYQEQISRIVSPITGQKMERSFNENLIETYLKIIKYSPPRAVRYLDLYLKRLELENIKTLIRAANAKLPVEQRLGRIYTPVAKYSEHNALMEEASKAPSLAHAVQVFKDTEYGEALSLGLKSFERTGFATAIDIFTDAFFYEQLYKVYSHLPRAEKSHAAFYAGMWNDSFVLLTLLRGKNLGYDSNMLRLSVPKETFKLTREVEAIITALNFATAFKIVKGSHYTAFFELAETAEETVANAEQAFQRALLMHAQKTQIREVFNISSTLGFITQKEAEVHNLVAATLGVEAGMTSEDIQNQLWL